MSKCEQHTIIAGSNKGTAADVVIPNIRTIQPRIPAKLADQKEE
jgi:hypothetical protein